ncbi:hypothetical protein LCGC14_0652240 [marine sediment metagenome]|uniref:Uncharacterized protein n=1 Tax=marine sediment metagenome TaxID=412755 RepID=A0A0F9THR1_9ZZZZ
MSCEDCENKQEIAFNKNIDDSPPIVYVRIGNSNMAIVGCRKHCKELLDRMRKENDS